MLRPKEQYDVTFTGYTSEGMAVCHVENEAVFVPDAIRGESATIEIVHVGQRCAYGKLVSLLEKSPHRIQRACPSAKQCGGCTFHHMDYEEECALKARRVTDALNRIGGQALDTVPILGSEAITGYRNKAQYPVAEQKGKPMAGFYKARTHQVIPISHCSIQAPVLEAVRAVVLDFMQQYRISVYDETTGRGLLRHLYCRTGHFTGQLLVCLVVNGSKLPKSDRLLEMLREKLPQLTTLVLNENKEKTNVVLGSRFHVLWGPGYIEDILCGFRFHISPRSFYQVNPVQTERLYALAVQAAGLTGKETVLDLYCGTGTITLALSREAKQAIGVEVVPAAIEDAKRNAKANHVENVSFFCADAGNAAEKLAHDGLLPEVVVVDPPRKGLAPGVIEIIAKMAPRRVVYVSCDPATLARDVKRFGELGYALQQATAVDMFPRCAHVETVVLLSRDNAV